MKGLDTQNCVMTEGRQVTWPSFAPDEVQAVARVLRPGNVNYWTGEEGRSFEKEFAEFAECNHAIALSNGTVALEAALKALGIGPGNEVVTDRCTFIASASSAAAVGARAVTADFDRDSQNLTAETIESMITPRTKAIVAQRNRKNNGRRMYWPLMGALQWRLDRHAPSYFSDPLRVVETSKVRKKVPSDNQPPNQSPNLPHIQERV
jgi:hypothetical protein